MGCLYTSYLLWLFTFQESATNVAVEQHCGTDGLDSNGIIEILIG